LPVTWPIAPLPLPFCELAALIGLRAFDAALDLALDLDAAFDLDARELVDLERLAGLELLEDLDRLGLLLVWAIVLSVIDSGQASLPNRNRRETAQSATSPPP
jgi:hypothetical protein